MIQTTAKLLFLGAIICLSTSSCSKKELSVSPTQPESLIILEEYWSELITLLNSQPTQLFVPPSHTSYPAYSSLNLVTAYWVTGNNEYSEAAKRQLAYAHSLENQHHLYLDPNGTRLTRDQLARHLFSLVVASVFLEDDVFLNWADDAAESMLAHLQRDEFISEKGNNFTIFYSTYGIEPPYSPTSDLLISTNQNAAMGMAFTLLYNTPGSRYYQDPFVAGIANEEIEASMDPQLSNGALPLGDPVRPCYDTSYGAYTVFCWAVVNGFSDNQEWQTRISLAANWLIGVGEMEYRCYPQEGESDLWVESTFTRALITLAAGRESGNLLARGYDLLSQSEVRTFEMTKVGRETPFIFYHLAGFDQDDFLVSDLP